MAARRDRQGQLPEPERKPSGARVGLHRGGCGREQGLWGISDKEWQSIAAIGREKDRLAEKKA